MSSKSVLCQQEIIEQGPKRLEIEVTRQCPLKCVHCSVYSQDNAFTLLPIALIEKIILEFAEIGGKELVITGGEPLSRGSGLISQIIYRASECHLSTFIYTSGFLVDESFLKSLKDKQVTLCISIEGKEETHDSISSVKGSYRKAIATLALCSKYSISTVIHFTPMKVNYEDFDHIIEVYKKCNAKTIKIFNFSAQGRGLENKASLKLSKVEQATINRKILSLMKEDIVKLDFGGEIAGINTKCSVGQKIIVACDGNVLPCLGLRTQSHFIIGNVREKSLSELWSNLQKMQSKTCLCG